MRALDLTGQAFGRLTALKPTPKRVDGKVVWLCVCECGNEKAVMSKHLKSGATQSCGCIVRDGSHKREDLAGKIYSRLTVESFKNGKWVCICECGKQCAVRAEHLKSGATKSCGCFRNDRVKEACTTHGLSAHPAYFREQTRRRRIQLENQTPAWTDVDELRQFYADSPEGSHVDHDVPLNPRNGKVMGLHTMVNLQYLPAGQNLRKSDSFTPYIEIKATGQRIYLDN